MQCSTTEPQEHGDSNEIVLLCHYHYICGINSTKDYRIPTTCYGEKVLNGGKCNAALSNEAPPSEQKSQSLIGKVSASLQLPLEVPVAIETALWDVCLGLVMHTGWSSLRNKLLKCYLSKINHMYDTVFSLVISNMKFNCNLGELFCKIWCFTIQRDRSYTRMPERRFKDGRCAEWHDLHEGT